MSSSPGSLPRVLVVSHMYPSEAFPHDGIFIYRHLVALHEAGVDLRVLSPLPWVPPFILNNPRFAGCRERGKGSWSGSLLQERVRYLAVPGRLRWVGWWSMLATLAMRSALLRRSWPFDIIHAHTATPDGWVAAHLGRITGRPVICSIRGSDIHSYPYRSRVRRALTVKALKSAAAVVSVSKALAEEAERLSGCRPVVIYNGVDESFSPPAADHKAAARSELGIGDAERVLLFAGRCEAEKGFQELLEAWAYLAATRSGLVLLIAGGSRPERAADAGTNEAGGGRIKWLGVVPPSQMPRVYAAADVFVHPTWGEGMPNALLEAMATGIPLVATPVGGIPEVVENGVTGVLVPTRDPRRLAEGILGLLEDPGRAREIGVAAAASIRCKLSWRHHAKAHTELYSEILRRSSASGAATGQRLVAS